MIGFSPRGEKHAARRNQPLRNSDNLVRRLPLRKNHLLMALRERPEVIDRRERQLLGRGPEVAAGHAAAEASRASVRAWSARYAAKIVSASCIDSMAKR